MFLFIIHIRGRTQYVPPNPSISFKLFSEAKRQEEVYQRLSYTTVTYIYSLSEKCQQKFHLRYQVNSMLMTRATQLQITHTEGEPTLYWVTSKEF